jgi:hypothetical protein
MATPQRDPADHRDPFENLRLDEGFVRAARFIEPSAADREGVGDRRDPGRCQVVPAHRRLPAGMHRMVWAPRPHGRRRAARAVALIAVLAGLISVVITLRHTPSRGASPATAGAGEPRTSPVATTPVVVHSAGGVLIAPALLTILVPGDCVEWDPHAAGSLAAAKVSCEQPHQAEVIKIVDLGKRLPGDAWPGITKFDVVAGAECAQAFDAYTGNSVRSGLVPYSGALEPTADAWSTGVRKLACTAQLSELAPMTSRLGPVPTAA